MRKRRKGGGGGGYIYISKILRDRLKLNERVYCYIYQKGTTLLLAFTNEALFQGYRPVEKSGTIGIPGKLIKDYLEKGEKISIPVRVEDGNIFVDLEELRNDNIQSS